MKRIIIKIIIPIILYLFFFIPDVSSGILKSRNIEAKVIKVVDGDTITVQERSGKIKIRLLYIDTMESRKNQKLKRDLKKMREEGFTVREKDLIYLGITASKYLQSLLPAGKMVQLEVFYGKEKDKYGRTLAQVYYNKVNINLQLVRNGYARTYFVGKAHDLYKKLYLKAEEEARKERRGIWNYLLR